MKYPITILYAFIFIVNSSDIFGQLTILSGPKQASQYSFTQDIKVMVDPKLDFDITNKSTKGASDNFKAITDPNTPYKLAIIPSDYLMYMQAQDKRLNTQNTNNLKVVVPLSDQQIHLVTKASKGFKELRDLHGKVVAIGTPNQGTYLTANFIKDRSGVQWISKNMHFDDAYEALSEDEIDAFFIVSTAPIDKLNVNPSAMAASDKLALIPFDNSIEWDEYYKADELTHADYKWIDTDAPVATYSIRGLLVVNEAKLSDAERRDVEELRVGIIGQIEQLKERGHPDWKNTDLKDWKDSDWPLFKYN